LCANDRVVVHCLRTVVSTISPVVFGC